MERYIYATIDSDGIITDVSGLGGIGGCYSLAKELYQNGKGFGKNQSIVRPIRVISADDIIGKYWEDVDRDVLRIKKMILGFHKAIGYSEVIPEGSFYKGLRSEIKLGDNYSEQLTEMDL